MKNNSSQKHHFALYVPSLSSLIASCPLGNSFNVEDADFVHRIVSILRMQPEQSLTLFDTAMHGTVILKQIIKKRGVEFILEQKQTNIRIMPELIAVIPVLKKEALEIAFDSLTQIGVTTIQLVFTQKSQQQWSTKEQERATRIIIAAAEQSKNFAFAQLLAPISFAQMFNSYTHIPTKLFFDPQGVPFISFFKNNSAVTSLLYMIGPEGDLTEGEKKELLAHGFSFYALTPTILRACQATSLAAGIIRSLVR